VVRRVGYPDPATFLPTFAELQTWLDDALVDAGLASERTVVGGFSQGAVMSYALALASGRPRPAAILAFSGFIPRVDGFEVDLDASTGLPVSIAHGTLDPVIGVEFGRGARERLEAAGADVRYREDPVGHQISQGGLAQAREALADALGL
jgi:phospholipase/carboxylesterase